MFTTSYFDFGIHKSVEIFDTKTATLLKLIYSYGATLTHLEFNGRPIIEGFTNHQELEYNIFFKNAWLFPFANRINQGRYEFEGTTYQLPINDAPTGHALHGFIYNKPFEIAELNSGKSETEIKLRYLYDGHEPGYPFAFEMEVTYVLKVNALNISLIVKNTGKKAMPCAPGFHPYFKFGGRDIGDVEISFPKSKQVILGEDGLPLSIGEGFEGSKKIVKEHYDNAYWLDKQSGEQLITVKSGDQDYLVEMDFNYHLIRFFQVYTPPDRKSIAIEPMVGNVDCFNNRDGLVVLNPSESMGLDFQISIQGQ